MEPVSLFIMGGLSLWLAVTQAEKSAYRDHAETRKKKIEELKKELTEKQGMKITRTIRLNTDGSVLEPFTEVQQ